MKKIDTVPMKPHREQGKEQSHNALITPSLDNESTTGDRPQTINTIPDQLNTNQKKPKHTEETATETEREGRTGMRMAETQNGLSLQHDLLLQHITNEEEAHPSVLDENNQGEWITVKASQPTHKRSAVSDTNIQSVLAGKNRFQALEIIPLEAFEDDAFTPFGIDSLEGRQKALYKCKCSQKCSTAQQSLALKHAQEIRHPNAILKTTSPAG